MKTYSFFLLSILICLPSFGQNRPEIIPLPTSYDKGEVPFPITATTKIQYSNKLLQEEAYFLQKMFLSQKAFPLGIETSEGSASDIHLVLSESVSDDYQLSIHPSRGITISSATETGIFHGIISLLQLADQAPLSEGRINIPSWQISDRPAYRWRGFMLDESRHFFGMEKVKSLLDWMAYYKLNKFHWHLTDAQGWRIAINGYPKLALIGGIGDNSDPNAPARYYTQAEIKEIVRYAAERKIDIIPEIDMPGHATAANRAYPEFSGEGSEKYPADRKSVV